MHVTNTFQDLLGIEPSRQNQISDSINQISKEGKGVLVLLNFSHPANNKKIKIPILYADTVLELKS